MMFELAEETVHNAKIMVVGVGGGGGNAINTMIECGLDSVEFISANTDLQSLKSSLAPYKIQLGRELTKGLGAGANPDVGRNSALEDQRAMAEVLEGADMVFITAGMGGGTGTGGAPVIAKLAKDLGALTVGVVTRPFEFEGKRRSEQAERGIAELKEVVDTLITVPNERLLTIVGDDVTMIKAFKQADQILHQAVKGIADLISVPGIVNLDFADVKTVMSEMGMALMGSGLASGEGRAMEAATKAISSPLLEDVTIKGATGVLINISGGPDLTLHEINEASKIIQSEAHEDANILFGAVIDERMKDDIRVTVIATGFSKSKFVGRTAIKSNMTARSSAKPYAFSGSSPSTNPTTPAPRTAKPASSNAGLATADSVGSEMASSLYPVGASRSIPAEERPAVSTVPVCEEKEGSSIAAQNYPGDEYDIPTFLRKQAD